MTEEEKEKVDECRKRLYFEVDSIDATFLLHLLAVETHITLPIHENP